MKRFFLVICLTLISLNCLAVHEDAGTTGFAFAQLSFSPRASAMGSAYNGIANDSETVFYNPAGLYQIQRTQVNAVYMNYLEGINCGSILFAKKNSPQSAYAVYTRFLSTTETRTLSDDQGNYLGTDGEFGFSDIEAGTSYSYHVSNTLNLGATGKILYEFIDGNSAGILAFDLGLFHITENENLHAGISVKNIGFQLSSFTSSNYKENLPTVADFGLSYNIENIALVAADVFKELKGDYYLRFGLEYSPHTNLRLRTGYKSDGTDWKTGGDWEALSGLTGGFGIFWRNYEFNYAFMSYGDLGLVNQLGIKYKF